MSSRIPRLSGLVTLVCTVVAALGFVFFNNTFGGPRIAGGDRYLAIAFFDDSQGILKKSLVLQRGVKVGEVASVAVEGDRAKVTFAVDERYAPIYRDASVSVGLRTFFGEAYIDLEPGHEGAGELPDEGRVEAVPSVEYDEALEVLNDSARDDFTQLLRTFGRAGRAEEAAERTSSTYAGLARVVRKLRQLSDVLRGQESQIAGFVQDGEVVLGELGAREDSLHRIVSSGRVTLETLASRQAALEQGFAEIPRLLATARGTLASARPLLREARPLVTDLRLAAPDLTAALRDLRPAARDASRTVASLRPFNRAAVPVLRRALPTLRALRPAARRLEPAMANLVPFARHVSPRSNGFAAFFAGTADMNDNGDSEGKWTRFIFFEEPGEVSATRTSPDAQCTPATDDSPNNNAGACFNAYPAPNDAADNEPYVRGAFPRLVPFRPPRPSDSP